MTRPVTLTPNIDTEYTVTSDASLLPMNEIVRLVHLTKWAQNRPEEMIVKSARNSLCFGVRYKDGLAAFARLVTDYTTYAYLCDVIVDPVHRGKGLSKMMMRAIMHHPELTTIRRWALLTYDAHGLYRQFGFENPEDPTRYMEMFNPQDRV